MNQLQDKSGEGSDNDCDRDVDEILGNKLTREIIKASNCSDSGATQDNSNMLNIDLKPGSKIGAENGNDSSNRLVQPPSELSFNKPVLSEKHQEKSNKLKALLRGNPVNRDLLRDLAISEGGLVEDSVRRDAWPLLLNLTELKSEPWPTEDEILAHPEYNQVVLDVERSLKRFPPGIPLEQRLKLQEKLTRLILRVITKHRDLHYYQGYHDVAVTFLLVCGEEKAFQLLEHVSLNHFKDCMEPTIERTSYLLNYIYPLLKYENKKVYEHLDASGVGTVFALPWFITWFGHTLTHYSDVVRLYDYFLVKHPLAPVYFSSAIIVHHAERILAEPCDICALHHVLSNITDDLPIERLLTTTSKLIEKHPPALLESQVRDRVEAARKQQEYDQAQRKLRAANNSRNATLLRLFLRKLDGVRRIPFVGRVIPVRTHNYFIITALVAVTFAFYMRSIESK